MDFPIKDPWHSWEYTSISGATGQVGGYAVEYDIKQGNEGEGRFEFITIRGARHEVSECMHEASPLLCQAYNTMRLCYVCKVPESSPAKGLEMLRRFLEGKSF